MSLDPIRELRGTRVLVMHPADQEIDELLRHLRRIGCQTMHAWPAPDTFPEAIDVIFFPICPTRPVALPQATAEGGPALIAIVDFENPIALRSLLDANAHSVVAKPIRSAGILASLVMARSIHGYQGRLLNKVAKLEETLRSRREIEKATRILMEVKGSSEDSAYQLIRQQATAQRLAMGVVARSIITAHRVFDDRKPRDHGASVLRLPARKSP
ncbi:MAG TPA: ANTAR domain-containing protein [Burkholderiales bacterium]|nr:ANTAR domain-containing protein [Burkholderiales bacterium]